MPDATFRCDDTELLLTTTVHDLGDGVRDPVLAWLAAHGIAAEALAPGHPVVRDEFTRSVSWHEQTSGGERRRRWRYLPSRPGRAVPTPFPDAVRLLGGGA